MSLAGAHPPSPASAATGAVSRLDAGLRTRLLDPRGLAEAKLLPVFVQTEDAARTSAKIIAAGGRVGVVAGDVLTARLPRSALLELASDASVVRVEGARSLRRRLDTALPAMRVDQVHQGAAPLSAAHGGAGVVVGVVDIGLDFTHQAFKSEGGPSRVLALWDQDRKFAPPPAGYDYGSLCTAADIEAGACKHVATDDHGTHVTGIAAGGRVEGSPYVGVAPEADIVFVNLGYPPDMDDEYELLSTSICDGVAWIFEVAEAAGKPAVVNMSLGEHTGPHDGSSLGSRCLDNLSGPGRVLVAAAGNEGRGGWHWWLEEQVFVHAQGVATAAPEAATFLVTEAPVYASVWADAGAELSLRIGVVDEQGVEAWSEPFDLANPLDPQMLATPSGSVGPVFAAAGQNAEGAIGFQIVFDDENWDEREMDLSWRLEVRGQGRFDAFMDTTWGSGFLPTPGSAIAVDSSMTVGFPGDTRSVLAVASYVTRDAWTNATGDHVQLDFWEEPVTLAELSDFSSRGPSRNEALTGLKPDIAAPGELIASALSRDAAEVDPTRLLEAGGAQYVLMEGTSMASPAITGVVALMLEQDPELTADHVRAVFDETSMAPPGAHALPSHAWGRGKVDALASVAAAEAGEVDEVKSGGDALADDGCGCRAAGSAPKAPLWLLSAGVLAIGARRRRPTSPR